MADVRSPKQIFARHVETLAAADLDGLALDYGDASVLITAVRVYRGREEIKEFFAVLLDALPNADWGLKAEVYEGNLLYIEWTARSERHIVSDGVDTFVFGNGLIEMQTAHCTLVVPSLSAVG